MKITNETHYRTMDLKKFITWVSQQEGHTPAYRKRLKVRVCYGNYSGYAYLEGSFICVRLPKDISCLKKPSFASVVAHEMTHNHQTNASFKRYTTERNMRGHGRYGHKDAEKYWSESKSLELRVVEPKKKGRTPPVEKAQTGLKAAQAKVDEWERKERAAKNRVKKWRTKTGYYERRLKTLGEPQEKVSLAASPGSK